MKIDVALTGVISLAIESAPFIYFVEQNATYFTKVEAIFQRVSHGRLQAVISSIALTEVLVIPIRAGNVHHDRIFQTLLLRTQQITTVDVNPAIAIKAAELRAKYSLRTPDAIHVATAIVSQCDAFLTNDLGIKRVTDIPILVLDELEV